MVSGATVGARASAAAVAARTPIRQRLRRRLVGRAANGVRSDASIVWAGHISECSAAIGRSAAASETEQALVSIPEARTRAMFADTETLSMMP
jgi:hypothetical protein